MNMLVPWTHQVSIFYDNPSNLFVSMNNIFNCSFGCLSYRKLSIRYDAECIMCCSALPLYKEMAEMFDRISCNAKN